ncbi:MAG: cytochrome c oxidase subunit 3 [Alphaproteobacteria bacterium]
MAHQPEYLLDSGTPHPYHLVRPSPWPLLAALSAGALAGGAVMAMHEEGNWLLIAGFLGVLGVMFGWWRDVLFEAVKEKVHTPIVRIGFRYGMALFIASEVMFFAAFFWAFFKSALFPSAAIQGVWPPPSIHTFDPFHFPLLMTLILLLSGCTVTWAHHALIEGNKKAAITALKITVALGFSFSLLQAYEYHHASFGLKDTIYAATFYMATGFHGLHVIIGTIFLAVCLWRTSKDHFTPESHFGFEAAAWYWHFVDVVWLFLFTAVYWWGG